MVIDPKHSNLSNLIYIRGTTGNDKVVTQQTPYRPKMLPNINEKYKDDESSGNLDSDRSYTFQNDGYKYNANQNRTQKLREIYNDQMQMKNAKRVKSKFTSQLSNQAKTSVKN